MTLESFLAWPDGSGLVGTSIMGAAAYVHTHVRLARQHAERLAQEAMHHREHMAAIAPAEHTVNVRVDPGQLASGIREQMRRSAGGRP